MKLFIESTADKKITVESNGINIEIPFVNAIVDIAPDPGGADLNLSVICFKDNKPVTCNLSAYILTVANDTAKDPDLIISECKAAMINYLTVEKFAVTAVA